MLPNAPKAVSLWHKNEAEARNKSIIIIANLLLGLGSPRGLHGRTRAGRGEGSQHLDQVQRVLRRLLVVHGGGHGVLHQALAVQDDDPLQALALLLLKQIKPGGQLTAGVRPQGEIETSAQSSVLPGEIFSYLSSM